MAPEDLVGTWALVSFEKRRAGKGVRFPFGRHPRGYLVYTPAGLMSVAFMPAPRAPSARLSGAATAISHGRAGPWWRQPARVARYLLATTRYVSYSGRYTVSGSTVMHHVEVSLFPGLIGTQLVRTVELQGQHMILTADDAGTRLRLVWQRVAPNQGPGVGDRDARAVVESTR